MLKKILCLILSINFPRLCLAENEQTLMLKTQLRDIHLPPDVSWWPLACGWWIIILLSILLFIAISYRLIKFFYPGKLKRQAIKYLNNIIKEHQQTGNSNQATAQISQLLRRLSLAYYPRQQVAALSGKEWLNFLQKTTKNCNFEKLETDLLILPYKTDDKKDLMPLFATVRDFIQEQGKHA